MDYILAAGLTADSDGGSTERRCAPFTREVKMVTRFAPGICRRRPARRPGQSGVAVRDRCRWRPSRARPRMFAWRWKTQITSSQAMGASTRIGQVEWFTRTETGQVGQTVFFSDRGNKQISADFVRGDPRRGGRTNILYLVDQSDGAAVGGLTNADTEAA